MTGSDRLPRFCPNDDERLEPRSEEPLDVECPECGYVSARNLRGETVKICHKKGRITENSRNEREAYMVTLELGGIENRIAVTREFVRETVTEESEPEVMTDGGVRDGETTDICGYIGSTTGEPCQRAARGADGRCDHHPKAPELREENRWRDYSNVKGGREADRLRPDGGRPIPEVDGGGFTFRGPGDELRRCPDCGTVNNMFVNPSECYECGREWGGGGEVLDEDRSGDDGAEILTDGGEERVPGRGERATLTIGRPNGDEVVLSGEVDHASRCKSRVYGPSNDDPFSEDIDEHPGHMEPGVAGYVDVDGRRISFNTASERASEHFPEEEDAEDAVEFIGVLVETEFEGDA